MASKKFKFTPRKFKFRVWDKILRLMFDWEDSRDTSLLNEAFDNKQAVAMQFTGIKDLNGKEIYEGDIVTNDGDTGLVCWNVASGTFVLKVAENGAVWNLIPGEPYVVIGNVFENPNL